VLLTRSYRVDSSCCPAYEVGYWPAVKFVSRKCLLYRVMINVSNKKGKQVQMSKPLILQLLTSGILRNQTVYRCIDCKCNGRLEWFMLMVARHLWYEVAHQRWPAINVIYCCNVCIKLWCVLRSLLTPSIPSVIRVSYWGEVIILMHVLPLSCIWRDFGLCRLNGKVENVKDLIKSIKQIIGYVSMDIQHKGHQIRGCELAPSF
jgi:hypothetical protein